MKAIIKAIIAGSVIIGVGLILFIVALALNGWKFMPEFEMAEFSAEGDVTELKIDNSVGNIRTEFYDGDTVLVDYPVSDWYSMTIEEKDGVLTVNGLDKKHWYNFTFLPSTLPVTLVKIPKSTAVKLTATVNAGKVELGEGIYGETQVTVNAGSLNVLGMNCPDFKCEVNAGSIDIKSLESASLDCKVKAGSFDAERVACPKVSVNVSAGSADMKIAGVKEEYNISVDKSAGSCNVTDKSGSDPEKRIGISVSAGSVSIDFE